MKKLLLVATAVIVAMSYSYAQSVEDYKEMRKERQAITKMAKQELSAKVDKSVKKEAKRLKKEGWNVKPGALPLEKQLEKCFVMQYEYDENAFPKYIMADASSVGQTYDAAKRQAIALATDNIAAQIQTEVTALVENTVANSQLSAEDAASIVETVSASKNLISQSIGRTIVAMDCYRMTKSKNTEVLVRLAYNGDMAKKSAINAVREELEKKGQNLHEQLNKVLGF